MSVTAPGALVPLTQTFVQGSVTTAIALVGQILNNGHTNFVGYNDASAEYIFTSSEADAKQTTLADGNTYYVSAGSAPAGYLLTSGAASAATATASSDSASAEITSSVSSSGSSDSASTTTSSGQSSGSKTQSAAPTTSSPSSAQSLAAGAYLSALLGVFSVFALHL